MAEILAAGAVLWRPGVKGPVEIAVVHRPKYDDWSLPKGKLEPGEPLWAAAAREVAEETGFSATLGRYLGQVRYPVGDATKTVDYVAARARSGGFRPNREVDELRWLPPREAGNLLSYPHDLDIVRAFSALPAELTTLALVRHATAGRRADWSGPDDLRPLSDAGWQEVKALRAILPLFGVDRVHSAPLLRCTQTVQQLAEDLGTPVIAEPMLSERGYTGHEDAAVARLRQIAAAGGTPVVCSQGGVIPDLLSRLAPDSGLDLDDAPHRKGSIWLLSFTREARLLAAHYIPTP
ncbi:MAG TPA: NUDIX hydrolase [Actinophytocola sp.]|uniref:NUDIX hydrolase n=1 Tax=Actinophytocola sp. TaxID=1872138 RepID=UPI002DDDBB76|nr:NUDIX hydrolase [Actinophytocola sp.]HEV2778110.1 NUDIX hydrolase [Actinophytocola sp.]